MAFRYDIRQLSVKFLPVVVTAALSFATLITPAGVVAQVRFEVPLKVSDGAEFNVLYFGILTGANFCIVEPDSFHGHAEGFLPPPPPTGVFDTRLVWPRTGTNPQCFDQGSAVDFRPFVTAAQRDTFRTKNQFGTGTTMRISWPPGLSSRFTQLTLRYFDQDSGFNVNVNMLTDTSANVTGAGDQSTATIFSGGLVSVPAAPTLVSPPDGGIVPSSVTLTWNAVSGATVYHLQVSTDSLFGGSFIVNDSTITGTSRGLSGLAVPVRHFWRVSAGNVVGFGAYSSTRRFTTGTTPSVPVLVAPPNGSTGQPTTLTLRWNVSSSAQTYHVQLSTDSNFAALLVNDSTLTDTSRSVSGLAFSTKHYWHVRAKNGVGSSAYSTRFDFTTQLQPPPAPTLVSPSNGQTNAATTLPLRWNPVSGAATYRMQLATTSNFLPGTIVRDDSTLTTTVDTVGPLLNSMQYFWHVNAANAVGPGPYSTVWNFTTVVAAPPAPVLTSPPDGAVGISLVPTLSWNAAPTATTYRLQVALDSLFGVLVVDDTTITGTSRQIGQLLSATRYFWRVRGKNIGGSGPYSSTFRFTTTQAPPAPALVFPTDSALHVFITPTFVWRRVAGATSYVLQVATSPTFSTLVVNDSTIVDSTRAVSLIPYYGAILHWRVMSRNSSGTSDPSPARVFTVMLQLPGAPGQLAPQNNFYPAPTNLQFRWARVPLADSYELQIAFDTLCTNIFADTIRADTVLTMNVLPNVANYWRLRAFNIEHNFGPWSPVRRYTTSNAPAIPTPLSPANGDTGVARNICFRWTGVPGALSYRVQVSTNISFPPPSILWDSTLGTATFCPPGLLPSRTSLFWRVSSNGVGGSSQFCAVQAFTTSTVTDIEEIAGNRTPTEFVLHQNYPNPFNPSTTIPFEIATPAFVTLRVYDLLGREIETLVNGQLQAGAFVAHWDGHNGDDQLVPSGLYLARLMAVDATKSFSSTCKMMLLR